MTEDFPYRIHPDDERAKGNEFRAETEAFQKIMNARFRQARKKFPDPDGLVAALAEETGELSKAMLEEKPGNVYEEAAQVAAVAMRIALEGDPTLDDVRAARVRYGPGGQSKKKKAVSGRKGR